MNKKKFTKVIKFINGSPLEFKHPCRVLEVWNTYADRNVNQGFIKFRNKDVFYNAIFNYHDNLDNLELNTYQKEWDFSVGNEAIGGGMIALIEYYIE